MSRNFHLLEKLGEFPDLNQRRRKAASKTYTGIPDNERFLIIKHATEGKKISDLSVFGVQKSLEGVSKDILEVRAMKSGDLLVLTKNQVATKAFLNMKSLGGLADVKVEEHPFLNKSRGIIFCRQLLNYSEEEIVDGLKEEKVVEVKRMMRRVGGELVPTAGLILTFNSTIIPENIKVGYIQVNVRIYIPNPLRCAICQKFGHSKNNCRNVPKCEQCAEDIPQGHKTSCETIKCVNCSGEHKSTSRECPIFLKELEITKIKTIDRVPYHKARETYYRLCANTTGSNNPQSLSNIMRSNTPLSNPTEEKQTKKPKITGSHIIDEPSTSNTSTTLSTTNTITNNNKQTSRTQAVTNTNNPTKHIQSQTPEHIHSQTPEIFNKQNLNVPSPDNSMEHE